MPIRLVPIASLFGKNPANPATRVGHISPISGNHVQVKMENSLARRGPLIESDIEAVRFESLRDQRLRALNCGEYRMSLGMA